MDSFGDDFQTRFVWDGTRDRSPFLSIADAVDWRASLGGEDAIMAYNHKLAKDAGALLTEKWGTGVLDRGAQANSMLNVVVPTTNLTACGAVASKLHSDYATRGAGRNSFRRDASARVRVRFEQRQPRHKRYEEAREWR